jgi:hypothetical protein
MKKRIIVAALIITLSIFSYFDSHLSLSLKQDFKKSAPVSLSIAQSQDNAPLPPTSKKVLNFSEGSENGQLGVLREGTPIGPGGLKTLSNGHLIADTFNDRIIKIDEEGTEEFRIEFSPSSLIQGLVETDQGEIWALKKLDAKLYLEIFSSQGRLIKSVPVETSDMLFQGYVGTFRSIFHDSKVYLSTSTRVLAVNRNGETELVPGIPNENSRNRFLSVANKKTGALFLQEKDEASKVLAEFEVSNPPETLKNIYSLSGDRILLEFEAFDSVVGNNSQVLLRLYNSKGELLKEKTFDQSSDLEIDQSLDVRTDGLISHLSYQDAQFRLENFRF